MTLLRIKLQGLLHKILPLKATLNIEVLIVSYPCSGLSWFRFMLSDYMYGEQTTYHNLEYYLPCLGDELWQGRTYNKTIIGCHAEPRIRKLIGSAKVVYIYRKRDDILKSYCKAFNIRYNQNMSLKAFNKWMEKWYAYPMAFSKFRSGWSKQPLVYTIEYPFTIESMTKVIEHLGFTAKDHDERIKRIFAKFSRKNMKEMQSVVSSNNLSIY